jgi:hypothetical protein
MVQVSQTLVLEQLKKRILALPALADLGLQVKKKKEKEKKIK